VIVLLGFVVQYNQKGSVRISGGLRVSKFVNQYSTFDIISSLLQGLLLDPPKALFDQLFSARKPSKKEQRIPKMRCAA